MRVYDGVAMAVFSVLVSAPLGTQMPPSWTQVAATGPGARSDQAMIYDSFRDRTVMFGGNGNLNGFFGDTWEWDGSTWTPVASTSAPVARMDHAMVFDAQRRRTVLFGGVDVNGANGGWLNDTWEWDGTTWMQMASVGPSPRRNPGMAYDNQRGRTVLFGGMPLAAIVADTWEWDGASWTQIPAVGPSARAMHAMVYDSARAKTLLFGGLNNINGVLYLYNDTWEWDGTLWTQVASAGPPTREAHAMAYDSQRGRTVLFGGWDNGTLCSDTWEWDGSAWTQASGAGPAARDFNAMAYDSQRGCTVLFGGSGNGNFFGDTWEYGLPTPVAATATPYGSGCGSPALTLSPVASARPLINTAAQAALTNIPSSLAFVALGWSRTIAGPFPLPFTLAGYGMLGCDLLQSAEFAALPVTFTGTDSALFSVPVPNIGGLMGLHLYLQAWAVAPGANPGDKIVSNGIEWAIGNG